MKNYLLLIMMFLAAGALTFTSCEDGNNPGNGGDPEKEYKLYVDIESLTFAATDAAAQDIQGTTEGGIAWSVSFDAESAPWLHVTQKTKSVTVTVDNSLEESERKATFTITAGEPSVDPVEITVTQKGLILLDAMPKELSYYAFSSAYGAKNVAVTASNAAWDVEILSGSEWIHFERNETGISVSVDRNFSQVREGRLLITSDVEDVDDVEITVSQSSGEFVLSRGEYWANIKTTLANVDGGEYILAFMSADLDENDYVVGDGYGLFLDFIAPYPVPDKNPRIADGRYEANGLTEQYSIITGAANTDHSKIRIFKDSNVGGELLITGGYFDVTRDGDNYTFEFNLDLSDGTKFEKSWSGPVKMSHLDMISTNTQDRSCVMRGGGGMLNAWGGDKWDCWMFGEDLYWEDHNPWGYGDLMRITIYTEKATDLSLLPPGIYPINGSGSAGSALWGGWDNNAQAMAGMWGSWYIDHQNNDNDGNGVRIEGEYGALIKGTIDIRYNNATQIYNIIIDAYDDAGNKIDVDFEGPIGVNVAI